MRLGVCSDVHAHLDRLLRVQDAMNTVGVEERWCLSDAVGVAERCPRRILASIDRGFALI
jgi:hypothetical protein